MTKTVWYSGNPKKEGTHRIVLGQSASAKFVRVEERIRDNAFGEETWIPFDTERLPSWVLTLVSEFAYNKGEKDEIAFSE